MSLSSCHSSYHRFFTAPRQVCRYGFATKEFYYGWPVVHRLCGRRAAQVKGPVDTRKRCG
jgi:hypothetical protein